jgi:hypothetical protein
MNKEEFMTKWREELLNVPSSFIGRMFDDATIDRDGIIAELLMIVEQGKLMNEDIRDLTVRARHMIMIDID